MAATIKKPPPMPNNPEKSPDQADRHQAGGDRRDGWIALILSQPSPNAFRWSPPSLLVCALLALRGHALYWNAPVDL
jgi:hypothetical protein